MKPKEKPEESKKLGLKPSALIQALVLELRQRLRRFFVNVVRSMVEVCREVV